jgi:hypothetical protein
MGRTRGSGWRSIGGSCSVEGLGPQSLTTKGRLFGAQFRLVSSDKPTASYQSRHSFQYGRRILDRYSDLRTAFERSLIHTNRSGPAQRHFIVISDRDELLSQEAGTFLVAHHLSNMVRYRPEQVIKLSDQRWFFLFTTWLPRAMENYLLALGTRIVEEEIRIG